MATELFKFQKELREDGFKQVEKRLKNKTYYIEDYTVVKKANNTVIHHIFNEDGSFFDAYEELEDKGVEDGPTNE